MQNNLKQELTVERVAQVLQNFIEFKGYTTEKFWKSINAPAGTKRIFSVGEHNEIVQILLETFFHTYNKNSADGWNKKSTIKSNNFIKERFKNKKIDNILHFYFNSLYPNLIIQGYKNKLLLVNIPEYMIIYEFLLKNRKGLNYYDFPDVVNVFWKMVVNYFFGSSTHPKSLIRVKSYDPISIRFNNFMRNIFNEYDDIIIGVNTDTLFILQENKPKVDRFLIKMSELGTPYSTEGVTNFEALGGNNRAFAWDGYQSSGYKIMIKKGKNESN